MKKQKLLFLLFLALLGSTQLSPAQQSTAYMLVFGATEEPKLGSGFKKTAELLKEENERIAQNCGMKNGFELIKLDKNYNKEMALERLNNIELKPNDILIVWFAVHGLKSDNGHHLIIHHNYSKIRDSLDYNKNEIVHKHTIELTGEIIEIITGKMKKNEQEENQNLILIVAEACYSSAKKEVVSISDNNFLGGRVVSAGQPIEGDRYKELFMKNKGLMLVSAARPGQNVFYHTTYGGYFTRSFINEIYRVCNDTSTSFYWSTLVRKAGEQTDSSIQVIKGEHQKAYIYGYNKILYNKTEEKIDERKIQFLVTLIASLQKVNRDAKNKLKKFVKDPSIRSLNEHYKKETRDKLKKESPLQHAVIMALLYELKEETDSAFVYFSIAKKYYNGDNYENDKQRKNDNAFIKRFMKLSEKEKFPADLYQLIVDKSKNPMGEYLREKIRENSFSSQLKLYDYNSTKNKIENEINELSEEILGHQRNADSCTTEIAICQENIKKLKLGIEKMEKQPNILNNNRVDLGAYCSKYIQKLAKEEFMTFLNIANEIVPTEKRKNLGPINIELNGKADWHFYNPNYVITIVENQDFEVDYTAYTYEAGSHIKSKKTYSSKPGIKVKQSNEELALQRALCVARIIRETMDKFGYQYELTYIVHDYHSQLPSTKYPDDPGREYRGCDVTIDKGPFFEYYKRAEVDLKDRIRRAENLRENTVKRIEEKEEEKKRKEEEIKKLEQENADIEEILNTY